MKWDVSWTELFGELKSTLTTVNFLVWLLYKMPSLGQTWWSQWTLHSIFVNPCESTIISI